MGNFLSPGVYGTEIDLSTSVPSVATGITGFVGEYETGMLNKRIPVTNLDQYISKFGKPTDTNYNDWFQGERFLRNGSELYVVRSADTTTESLNDYTPLDSDRMYSIGEGALYNGWNYTALLETKGVIDVDVNGDPQNSSIGVWQKEEAVGTLPTFTEPKTMNAGVKFSQLGVSYFVHELIENDIDFDIFSDSYTQSGTVVTFFAKSPGSKGNDIEVSISNDLSKGIESPVSNVWLGLGSSEFDQNVTYSTNNVVTYNGKLWKSLQDSNNTIPGSVGSETYWENVSYNINDVVFYNGNNWYSLTSNNGDEPTNSSSKWAMGQTFSDMFDSKLYGSEYAVIIFENKKIVEKYIVSSDPTGTDADNNNIFIDNILNNYSEYVYSITEGSLPDLVQQKCLTGGKYSSPTTSNIIDSYGQFANSEDFDLSVLIANEKANQFVSDIAKQRADCIAIVGARKEDTVGIKDQVSKLVDYVMVQELNTENSYAAFYGNYIQIVDEYNAKYRWINVAGSVAGSQIRTNYNRDPWWANAGIERGQLGDVVKIAFNPTQGERDILYRNKINPIVNFPGQGNAIIWGQKTLLSRASSFDRINVRQLFLVIEKAVDKAMKYFVFEPNDVFLRAQIVAMITPFLEEIKGRKGIYEYKIVCDETNNTPEVIDSNRLRVDILVKPTRVAEFVEIKFVSAKTSANLTEIASQVA